MSITERPVDKPVVTGGNTAVTRPGIARTGFDEPDGRFVRVLRRSYLNGADFEPGAITHWPRGVEKLGDNLEEYKG